MFGPKKNNGQTPGPAVRAGSDVARLSTNLLQVMLQSADPPNYQVFLNGEAVPAEYIDNIVVSIEAPQRDGDDLTMQAILSRKSTSSVSGPPQTNLFPGVVDIVGMGRRLVVVGTPDEDVILGLGLESRGLPTEAHGAQKLSVLFTNDVVTVQIRWTDGVEEDLFPTG